VLPAADNSWSNADELRQAPATCSISAGHYRQPAVFRCRPHFYSERVPTSDKRVVYLDSSALVKLVVRESESAALRRELRSEPERASCALARVEVVRAVRPHGAAAVARARRLLRRLDLVQLDEELLDAVAVLDDDVLWSLDAIHLAAAQLLGDDLSKVITYDQRMTTAAKALGLTVSAPR
jgi:predicted nucleic acid-binding protein